MAVLDSQLALLSHKLDYYLVFVFLGGLNEVALLLINLIIRKTQRARCFA